MRFAVFFSQFLGHLSRFLKSLLSAIDPIQSALAKDDFSPQPIGLPRLTGSMWCGGGGGGGNVSHHLHQNFIANRSPPTGGKVLK